MTRSLDIAVIGAGPYGLAAAAHLLEADSLELAVFGRTMSFWQEHMPRGMFLRSPYVASSIADPSGRLSLGAYERAIDAESLAPVPLQRFLDYGGWFQRQALPDLSDEHVRAVSRNDDGFVLGLDGREVHAKRVVVAAGIKDFASFPAAFEHLPASLVSHTADHHDLGVFGGARVLVVGAGQSALESAAILAESGAEVEVAARAPAVHWLAKRWQHKLGPLTRMLYAWPDVGPAGVSRLVAAPAVFRRMPRRSQTWMTRRALRPAGSGWLVPRVHGVTIGVGLDVREAQARSGGVRVRFGDDTVRDVDHVLLGTGYRVDVTRYRFLSEELVRGLRCVDGYPVLGRGFESSVPGLHFVGATAAWSYGPLMRFVAGTGFAGRELVRGIVGRRRRRPEVKPWAQPHST
jgi:FAD-dependent urate hydroxylase